MTADKGFDIFEDSEVVEARFIFMWTGVDWTDFETYKNTKKSKATKLFSFF